MKVMNMVGVALVFLVIFALVHILAMQVVGNEAMTNHSYLAAQAFVAGLVFYVACKYSPQLHKLCCEM